MTEFDEKLRDLAGAAARDLKPLIEEAAGALSIGDDAGKEELGLYLSKAWQAGVMAGQEAIVAQAKEQGANVEVTPLRASGGAGGDPAA